MTLELENFIDLDKMQVFFELNLKLTGISSVLIALDGRIYVNSGWQTVCSRFNMANPDSLKLCRAAYENTCKLLSCGEQYVFCTCPFGLKCVVVAVRVNGEYVANLVSGKVFLKEPDSIFFEESRNHARRFGFDEEKYLEAYRQIPVIPELKLDMVKESLLMFVEMIGGAGTCHLIEQASRDQAISAYEELQKEIGRRESEEKKLRQIIEGNAIATFVIDANSKVTHWNKACELLTGFRASEVIGTDRHQEVFYSSKRLLLADFVVRNVDEQEINRYYGGNVRLSLLSRGAYEGEGFFPDMGKDGKILFFTSAPLTDSSGQITGSISTLQDITEARMAEKELRSSEERYRHLFESANDAILLIKDGKIADCNQKALFLFRCSRPQLIGLFCLDISPEKQPGGELSADEIGKMSKMVYQNIPLTFEWRFTRNDGSCFDAGVSITMLMISSIPYALSIIRDISETKRLINSLRMREAELDDKTGYLEKVNQALKASLDHRDVERRAVEESFLSNLKQFVFPYIQDLTRCEIDYNASAYLSIIKRNLDELVSPFTNTIFSRYIDLTPTEIRVADFIREGRNTKEIAAILGLSPVSVQWHRKNIREKLGLTNKKNNLQSFLKALS